MLKYKLLSLFLLLILWGSGLYCFAVSSMYYNLGKFEYFSTLSPVGATSVLYITQAYIKGRDLEGNNIILKHPMLPLVEMKSQDELKDWVKETLSSFTTVHVNKIENNKTRTAYISSPPHFILINMLPWMIIGIYITFSGTYNVIKLYQWLNKDRPIPDNQIPLLN
jgi:hypothetical protein